MHTYLALSEDSSPGAPLSGQCLETFEQAPQNKENKQTIQTNKEL